MCKLGVGFSLSLDSAWHKHKIFLIEDKLIRCCFLDISNKDVFKMTAVQLGDLNIITACLEEPDI